MKKILSFIFMLLAVLGFTTLTACGTNNGDENTPPTGGETNTDQTVVDEVAKSFSFTTTEVSTDFTLKTSAAGGVVITWTSDNAAIVIDGQNAAVTRPAFEDGDVTVTLTATFTKGTATATKTYQVKVLKGEDTSQIQTSTVAEALAFAVGETVTVRGVVGAFHVGSTNYPDSRQGLYLFDTTGAIYVYGYQLAGSVEIGDEIVIEAKRAEHNGAAQLATPNLVGDKLSEGNAIPRDAAKSDVTIGDLAADLNGNYFGLYLIFENVTVKKIDGGTYVSYTLLDANGNEVNLYSGGNSSEFAVYDQYIGKTLKLSYMVNGKNSKGTKWRGHIVEILEVGGDFAPGQGGNPDGGEVPTDTITVAEAIAASVNSEVVVKGVVAGFHVGNYNNAPSIQGCYIADTTGIIYVYGYIVAQNVAVGDEIIVTAKRAEHNGAYQLANPTLNSKVSTGNAIPKDYAITDKTLADVASDINGNYFGKAFVFTNVTIKKIDGGSYINYVVIDEDDNALNLYSSNDSSEFAVYDQYIGKSIDLLYVVNSKNSKGDKWRGHPLEVLNINGDFGGNETPEPDPVDDETKVTTTESELPSLDICNENFTLPVNGTKYNTVTITWSSDNAAIAIDGAKATVTRPAVGEEDVTVVLTATIKSGEVTKTKEITVTVNALVESGSDTPEPGINTIAEALKAAEGTKVTIQGTVSKIYQPYDSGYNNVSVYITDETGTILSFRLSGNAKLHEIIKVTGTVTDYNGTMQIAQGATFELLGKEECSEFKPATCVTPASCVVCGAHKDEIILDHTYVDGLCSVCQAVDPDYEGEVSYPSVNEVVNLSFKGAANKADGDAYFTTNYPDWSKQNKLGQTYGGYLGFGRSGDKTSSITSSQFTADSDFQVKAVVKGNGNNGVMTSTLTFTLLDDEGNVIATGYANGSATAAITPADAKDTTYNISFTYVEGKTYADAARLKISFSKGTGNIGLKSVVVA